MDCNGGVDKHNVGPWGLIDVLLLGTAGEQSGVKEGVDMFYVGVRGLELGWSERKDICKLYVGAGVLAEICCCRSLVRSRDCT